MPPANAAPPLADDLASEDAAPDGDLVGAMRTLAPAAAVEVECVAGAPCALVWQGRRVVLVRVQGPERLGGEWWSSPWQRDYWRGEGMLDGDARADVVLYRDRQSPERGWFLHGWVD